MAWDDQLFDMVCTALEIPLDLREPLHELTELDHAYSQARKAEAAAVWQGIQARWQVLEQDFMRRLQELGHVG